MNRSIAVSIDVDTLARDLAVARLTSTLRARVRLSWNLIMPRLLAWLSERHIKATFFLVADDILDNLSLAKEIVAEGHEAASHSRTHSKLIAAANRDDRLIEIRDSKRMIEDALGCAVMGFRAPGYCISNEVMDSLEEAGYLYDASLNVSFPYNLVKLVWRSMMGEYGRNNLAVESPLLRRLPDAFHPARLDYRNPGTGSDRRTIVEIPIFIMNRTHLPLATSLFHSMGSRLTRALIVSGTAGRGFIPMELHDFEFGQPSDNVAVNDSVRRRSFMRYFGAGVQNGEKKIDEIIDMNRTPPPRFIRLCDHAAEYLAGESLAVRL